MRVRRAHTAARPPGRTRKSRRRIRNWRRRPGLRAREIGPRWPARFAQVPPRSGTCGPSPVPAFRRGIPVAFGSGATRRMAARYDKRGNAAQRTALRAVPQHPVTGRMTMQLVNTVKSFVRNEEGQDLLEYALLVALIALVAIAAVTAAGGSVSTIFQTIAGKLAG